MQIDPFGQFVTILEVLLTPFGLQDWAPFVAILPFLVLLYIFYLILVRLAKMSFKKVGMPPEATTGVIFGVRLVFFGIALLAVLAVTNLLLGEGIIAFGALIGTALGLAFSKSLSNLVSGLYVFAARPFRVGDYVRIGNYEGIVSEITLNYTRLLMPDYTRQFVPNSKVIDSEITNYRVRIDDLMSSRGQEYQEQHEKTGRFQTALDRLKQLAKGEEVFYYTFEIVVHKDFTSSQVRDGFANLCDEWEDKFLEKPTFFYWNNQNFGVTYRFGVIVKDPYTLLTEGADFQSAIAHSFQS